MNEKKLLRLILEAVQEKAKTSKVLRDVEVSWPDGDDENDSVMLIIGDDQMIVRVERF